MTAAIISIGTELTRGELTNTNAVWLSEELVGLGFDVIEHVTVDDDTDRIVAAIDRLSRQVGVVLVTGGLGSTTDDLTTEAVARALNVPLLRDESIVEGIRNKFKAFGRTMPEANAKQGDFPEGATILDNAMGTAPGFSMAMGDAVFFFTPGVPREMKHVYERWIVPAVQGLARRTTHQIHMRTFGMTESGVAEELSAIESDFPGVTVGYRAHFPEIEVKVHARGESSELARRLASEAAEAVRAKLGEAVFGGREDTFAAVVGDALRKGGLTLAVAESCTGGKVGDMLTAAAGSSDFLLLDAVTYANAMKEKVLGVSAETLLKHGAVSEEVATQMAEGALKVSGADIAVAITGIAGPGGGSAEKPVGTVWFGLAKKGASTVTKKRKLPGNRERVRTLAAYTALKMVHRATWDRPPDTD